MIKTVEVFETEDNSLFRDLQEAERHQRYLNFEKDVEEFVDKEYFHSMNKSDIVELLDTFVKRFNLKVVE